MKKQLSKIATALTIIIPTMSVLLVAVPIIVLVINNSKSTQHLSELQIKNIKNTLEKKNEKTIILDSSKSGSITAHANDIKMELQKLIGSKKIDGVSIIISSPKSQTGNIDHKIVRPIIINLKKEKVVSQIFGFKVKRKKNNDELIQGLKTILENVVKDDDNIKKTIVLASDKTGTIETHKDDIKTKIKEIVGESNLNGAIITLAANEKALDKIDHKKAKAIIIALKKGLWTRVVIDGFKVKREKNDKEWVEYVKGLLVSKDDNTKTIVLASDKTGTIETHKVDIQAKIEGLVGKSNLNGVSIAVEAGVGVTDNIHYEKVGAIKITLNKGSSTKEVDGFLVKRSKSTQDASNEQSIKNLQEILDNKDDNTKTIVLASDKTETIENHKDDIKAKIKEIVGESNLNGVKIAVEAGVGVTDNIHYKNLRAIKLILSKGSATQAEVVGFKVIRERKDEEWIEYVKGLLVSKDDNEKTIVLASDKTGTIETHKVDIQAKIEGLVGKSNLNGVSIAVEAGVGVTDNIHYEKVGAIKITLNKGSSTKEVDGFLVKRSKSTQDASNEESIKNLQEILDNKDDNTKTIVLASDKTETIENHKDDIKAKIKEIVGESNLNGVTITIKPYEDSKETKINEKALNFKIILKKSKESKEITSFSVKRRASHVEDLDFISKSLKNEEDKIIILDSNLQGSISDQQDQIQQKIRQLIKSYDSSVTISLEIVKKNEDDSQDSIDSEYIIPITITIKKGKEEKEIKRTINGFSVKRLKTQDEKDAAAIKKIIDKFTTTPTTISTTQKLELKELKGKFGDYEAQIKTILRNAMGIENIEIKFTTSGWKEKQITVGEKIEIYLRLDKGTQSILLSNKFTIQVAQKSNS